MARTAGKKSHSKTPEGGPPRFLLLEIVVFVAGASVMALEIAGSRLLAPHFGNSVFVWGSLISVFLIALSAGYFIGGRIADETPSFARLNVICLTAAVMIAVVPFIGHGLCRTLLSWNLGEQSGPIVAAGFLFLPPSVLLGMVSPFSVRLATSDVNEVGRAAGRLYALSTLGSIAGTLATTFVLVPRFGVSLILKGLAATLLLTCAVALVIHVRRGSPVVTALVLGALAIALPSPPAAEVPEGSVVLVDEDTPYHHVRVIENPQQRVRYLTFDNYVESSMDTYPPYRSRSAYTDYFHLAFLLRPKLERVAFIGAGGGLGPRAFRLVDPELEMDVVDIDPRVLELAVEHFEMPVDERVRAVAEDGRSFIRSAEKPYGCIVLDAFTIGGRIPFHLATAEYFAECRAKLMDDGVFVMNINSALEGDKGRIFQSVGASLEMVFPTVYSFAAHLQQNPSPEVSRNIVFVATTSEIRQLKSSWSIRVAGYPHNAHVSRPRMRQMIGNLVEPWPDFSGTRPLTDELAPIETMPF